VNFKLIQLFQIKDFAKLRFIRDQLQGLRRSSNLFNGFLVFLPSKGLYAFLNSILLYFKLLPYIFRRNEILIFSRALIGREINFLRKITNNRIIFYFDARAAAAEEKKYVAINNKNFSLNKYVSIANIYYLEYKTLKSADKIFTVSKVLQDYFHKTFAIDSEKFVHYPCLSDSKKFYFNPQVRKQIRKELEIPEEKIVFIYPGGIGSEWHVAKQMLRFFNDFVTNYENVVLVLLTRYKDLPNLLSGYPNLRNKCISFYVPNHEVYKYLNSADFGILFRENTVMNNVASPTKFAEYMLCGLPVLISEGVGDYSDFTRLHKVGITVNELELRNAGMEIFKTIYDQKFDRLRIADVGIKYFSKGSIINELVDAFKI